MWTDHRSLLEHAVPAEIDLREPGEALRIGERVLARRPPALARARGDRVSLSGERACRDPRHVDRVVGGADENRLDREAAGHRLCPMKACG